MVYFIPRHQSNPLMVKLSQNFNFMYLLLTSAVYTAVSDMNNFSCMWHCMDKVRYKHFCALRHLTEA